MADITLPIGISFFTFQALSYVIDVYYERVNVQKNPLYIALYISPADRRAHREISFHRGTDHQTSILCE